MNLKLKTHQEIHEQTIQAATNEKIATLVLLEYLLEIEVRKLFAVYGYGSLWEYVHKELKYSEAQTSDRISAMFALKKVPELKSKLEEGAITLTTAAKLGSHIRRERPTVEETKELILEICNKSSREVEKLLSPAKFVETTKLVVEIDVDFLKLIEEVRLIKSDLGLTPKEVFALTMKEFVKSKEHQESKRQAQLLRAPEVKKPEVVQANKSTRYIRMHDKTFIKLRAQNECEYISPVTNKKCTSRHQLQFDHIAPYAKGGKSNIENLRLYCRQHNQLTAIDQFGPKKMNRYLQK